MKNTILFSLLTLLSFSTAIAQNNWELKKNENGIAVYTRKAIKGNLQELRVMCELDATKEQLVNTLLDINNYDDWVYANRKAEVLKNIGHDDVIYYTQTSLPWPLKNRDLVVELTIDNSKPILFVQAKSLPKYLPKNEKFVRVPYSLAIWHITQSGFNKIKVDYTFSVDPGGSVPAWIVNSTMTIGPYNSFVKLQEVLKKNKSQPVHYVN